MSDIYLPPKVKDEFVLNGEFITEYKADHPGRLWIHESVTRCRDCKHWFPHTQCGFDEDNDEYHDYCGLLIPDDDYYAYRRKADDYCSYGERSESETEV